MTTPSASNFTRGNFPGIRPPTRPRRRSRRAAVRRSTALRAGRVTPRASRDRASGTVAARPQGAAPAAGLEGHGQPASNPARIAKHLAPGEVLRVKTRVLDGVLSFEAGLPGSGRCVDEPPVQFHHELELRVERVEPPRPGTVAMPDLPPGLRQPVA